MTDRYKSVGTSRGYVRDATAFRDRASAGSAVIVADADVAGKHWVSPGSSIVVEVYRGVAPTAYP
jgi:hypothetical protein